MTFNRKVLLSALLMLTGCASQVPIPVAVECPPFPSPPPQLMTEPPTMSLLQIAQ